eukprot:GILK01006330.1.p1 GENE.GILK01006330.1~~GILK01006330.1.p1  ORF type:complete len:164 (-),score=18.95 GILK01006330.1:253-711(-)
MKVLPDQLSRLEHVFAALKYPDERKTGDIATDIKMPACSVTCWFHHRRKKEGLPDTPPEGFEEQAVDIPTVLAPEAPSPPVEEPSVAPTYTAVPERVERVERTREQPNRVPWEEAVSQLMDMGIGRERAEEAMRRTNGNLEAAAEWLFAEEE